MILCVCRRISDRHVHEAREQGTTSIAALFRSRGCQPQCGSCVPLIRDMIGDSRTQQETPRLAAAE
jgi:bacterioferritin-associated ferredoxin